MTSVGLVCIVHNDQDTIAETILSVKDHVKHIIIYDTGSTDDTIGVIQRTCSANGLNLHCRFGKFVDSVTNRNASLDYADNVPVDYLILLNAGEKYICEQQLIKNRSKLRYFHM